MIIPLMHAQKKKQRKHYNIPCKTASPKSYFVNTFIYIEYVPHMFSEAGTKPNAKTKSSCRTSSIPSRSFKTLALLSWDKWRDQVPTCNLQYLAICDEESAKYKG